MTLLSLGQCFTPIQQSRSAASSPPRHVRPPDQLFQRLQLAILAWEKNKKLAHPKVATKTPRRNFTQEFKLTLFLGGARLESVGYTLVKRDHGLA